MLYGLISPSACSEDLHVRNSNMKILHKSENKDHQNTVPGEKYVYVCVRVYIYIYIYIYNVWWLKGHISKVYVMDSHIS